MSGHVAAAQSQLVTSFQQNPASFAQDDHTTNVRASFSSHDAKY